MKKVLILIGFVFAFSLSKANAYPLDVPIYKSTTIAGGQPSNMVVISSFPSIVVDYLVLSTGDPSETLNFYDSNVSTVNYLVAYTSYPTTAYGTSIPVGVSNSSGTAVLLNSSKSNTRVKIRFYRNYHP